MEVRERVFTIILVSLVVLLVIGLIIIVILAFVPAEDGGNLLQEASFRLFNETVHTKLGDLEIHPKDRENLHQRFENKEEITQPTIFVSVASFCDSEVALTVRHLFQRAYNPHRVFVGVVQQNGKEESPTCFCEYLLENPVGDFENNHLRDHLRISNYDRSEAKGPCWARHRAEKLYNGETYYLQIDSHMRFEPGWDVELIWMLLLSRRPQRTILTVYPGGYDRIEKKNGEISYELKPVARRRFRTSYFRSLSNEGWWMFSSTNVTLPKNYREPPYTGYWAAGFAFSNADRIKEAPYEDLPYVFVGEEQAMMFKYFIMGWDIRLPLYGVIYHLWLHRAPGLKVYRPSFRTNEDAAKQKQKQAEEKQAHQYIRTMMTNEYVKANFPSAKRSVKEFFDYVAIDPEKKKYTGKLKKWCLPKFFRTISDEFRRDDWVPQERGVVAEMVDGYIFDVMG